MRDIGVTDQQPGGARSKNPGRRVPADVTSISYKSKRIIH
jgi:hypothetical protein